MSTRPPVVPVRGTEAQRLAIEGSHPELVAVGEQVFTTDQQRLWQRDTSAWLLISAPVHHGDVATEAAMLALETTATAGVWPGDTAYVTAAGCEYRVASGAGATALWRRSAPDISGKQDTLANAADLGRLGATNNLPTWDAGAWPSGGAGLCHGMLEGATISNSAELAESSLVTIGAAGSECIVASLTLDCLSGDTVQLAWDCWLSQSAYGTSKSYVFRVRRGTLAGEVLASSTEGDHGDSTQGHQSEKSGTLTTTASAAGETYLLTCAPTGGTAYSASRAFSGASYTGGTTVTLSAGGTHTLTIPVAGVSADTSAPVMVGGTADLPAGIVVHSARVTGVNTVALTLVNQTSASLTILLPTLRVALAQDPLLTATADNHAYTTLQLGTVPTVTTDNAAYTAVAYPD